jgi:diguanylate cyclase (GGDEF)-like protein/PAS domain S-box-containing protein
MGSPMLRTGRGDAPRKPLDAECDRLREELALLRTVADSVPAMLAYWDVHQRNKFANRAYEKWFGVRPETLLGRTMKELLGPIYPLNLPYIEGALRGEPQQFDREIPDPAGGPPRYSQANYIPDIVDGKVRGFSVLVADITRRRRLEEQLLEAQKQAHFLATHDALTGLPNRALLEDAAHQLIELARRNERHVGLLFLDLDGFKEVNDRFGHACGDELLIEVARRLELALRSSDLVTRIGGDEFVMLLPDLEKRESATYVAQKLIATVAAEPFVAHGQPVPVTFSIGIALFPDDGADLRTLLSNADVALADAKGRGKNRWTLFDGAIHGGGGAVPNDVTGTSFP